MDLPTSDHVDERLESVPWDDLIRPTHDPRQRVVLALFAAVVVVIAASAARTLWPSPPLAGPTVVSAANTNSVGAQVESLESTLGSLDDETLVDEMVAPVEPISEADLRAVSPLDAGRTAVAYAELFVYQWLTLDGGSTDAVDEMLPSGMLTEPVDPSARSFVESAIGMSATEIGASTWQVEVVVRSLSAFADGEYLRVPPRAYSVTIRLTDHGPAIVDLPSPSEVAISRVGQVDTEPAEAPEEVMTAARSIMGVVGLIDDTTLTSSKAGDAWRVAGVVRDGAGVPVRIAIWLDGQGRRITVPVG